jgi:outer membrane protein insertion porin family
MGEASTPRHGWRAARGAVSLFLCAWAGRAAAQPPLSQDSQVQRPVVRAISVEGNQRYTDEQLVAALGQRLGAPLLDEPAARRGVEVLFDTFHVRATLELLPFAGEPGAVELRLKVEELPIDLELRITGNVEIDDEQVREWAGVGEREELFLFQAPRIRQRLLQRYREEGFHFVEVRVVERPAGVDPETGKPVAADVIFEIREGPEVKVRDVELHGNHLLPEKGFLFFKRGLPRLARAELRKPRLLNFFAKDFVEDTLRADIVAMRGVYRDLGYLDAVVELERLEFSADREWVTIHIAIDEGPPFTVGSLDFAAVRRVEDQASPQGYREEPGDLMLPAAELGALCKLRPGEVYRRHTVDDDHRTLREFFGRRGHLEHPTMPAWEGFEFLDPELRFEPDSPVVHVTYRLVQGEPQYIREIRVRGNVHTQDRVIRRAITVDPGDLADPTEIERSRARIEATGFFSPDTFHPEIIPPHYRYLETGDPSWKDLEYVIDEGGVLSFNVSGGISTTSGAFGTIELSKGNFDLTNLPSSPWNAIDEIASLEAFHGAGQTLRVSASPGTELTRYGIFFFEPDLFRLHEERIGLALDARRSLRAFETHDEERRDYSARLSRQISADADVFVRFDLGTVEVDDVDTGGEPGISSPLSVPADLKAQEGEHELSHTDLGYEYYTVDNRLFPRNGVDVDLTAFVYNESLESDFDFVKLQARLDFYDEFDEDPDIVSDYVHLALLGGLGLPYGDTDEIPYTERWFLGGRQMRGFDFRGVGPNENGDPIGGSTVLFGSIEYRRPLVKNLQPGSYRELEAIQGGVFLDAGVLDPEDLSLDFSELRVSTGFIFGIALPGIPLSFSFGFPLREGDEDDTQVFEFQLGL